MMCTLVDTLYNFEGATEKAECPSCQQKILGASTLNFIFFSVTRNPYAGSPATFAATEGLRAATPVSG